MSELSLNLSPEAKAALEEISRMLGGVSFAEVIGRALGVELFLLEERDRGSRIMIEKQSGGLTTNREELLLL